METLLEMDARLNILFGVVCKMHLDQLNRVNSKHLYLIYSVQVVQGQYQYYIILLIIMTLQMITCILLQQLYVSYLQIIAKLHLRCMAH